MKRIECPTCHLDMNAAPRSGYVDCPQCGQGLSKVRAQGVLSPKKIKALRGASKKEDAGT